MALSLTDGDFAERGLRGGKARNRHAVRRAGHVVQPDLVTERDRSRSTTVLATDAHLQLRANLAATLRADPHQFAYTVTIERDERICLQNALGDIRPEERGRIVAADAEARLREVVGTKREELGGLGDVAGHETRAWL